MGSRRRSRIEPSIDEEVGEFEFQHVGFSLSIRLQPDRDKAQIDELVEQLVREVLSPVSLECGGGAVDRGFEGFVTRWKGSATEDDRRAVARWLSARPEVDHFELGSLSDAWYGV